MSNRFRDALLIQQGAVNPSGIALTLHEACKACIAEGVSQRDDPAVRLIAHQLAFILKVREIDDSLTAYGDLTRACEERAKASKMSAMDEAGVSAAAFDWKRFIRFEANVVIGAQTGEQQVDISGIDADETVTPIVRCPTLTNGVRVAHELVAISGKYCLVNRPDLGAIDSSDKPLASDEAANEWIDARKLRRDSTRLFCLRPLQTEPDWACFDRLEIDGRARDSDSWSDDNEINGLADDKAEYWIIQARGIDGDVEDLTELFTLADAIQVGQELANRSGLICAHPRLGNLEPGGDEMTDEEAENWLNKKQSALKNSRPSF